MVSCSPCAWFPIRTKTKPATRETHKPTCFDWVGGLLLSLCLVCSLCAFVYLRNHGKPGTVKPTEQHFHFGWSVSLSVPGLLLGLNADTTQGDTQANMYVLVVCCSHCRWSAIRFNITPTIVFSSIWLVVCFCSPFVDVASTSYILLGIINKETQVRQQTACSLIVC